MTPSLKAVREALEPFAKHAKRKPLMGGRGENVYERNPADSDTIEGAYELTWGMFRRAAALYDSLLTAQAEANVSEIRSWDAPGFDACVKAERERLAQMEDRAGDYKAQAVIDPKPKSLLEMVEEQSARPVPPFGYHPLPDDAAASPSPSALTEDGVTEETLRAALNAFHGQCGRALTDYDVGERWRMKNALASALSPKGGT